MGSRTDLQNLLEDIMNSRNVYFQPPESVQLVYPCIKYSRDSGKTYFANDKPYYIKIAYQLILIDSNPDSEIIPRIEQLPRCTFERHFTSDNLHHYVYNLYY